MRNGKKLLCMMMAVATVFTLAIQVSAAGNQTEYPLTITTYSYEKEEVQYTFEKAPERVWAQNQNNIEVLLALGLGI